MAGKIWTQSRSFWTSWRKESTRCRPPLPKCGSGFCSSAQAVMNLPESLAGVFRRDSFLCVRHVRGASVWLSAGLKLQGGLDSGAQPVDRRLQMPQGDPQVHQSSGGSLSSSWLAASRLLRRQSEKMGLNQASVNPNHLRLQVLPPLKDVKIRPEVGSTLRNKLVRLMTHVDMGVKQTAAEFLFVLCKESGERLMGPWGQRLASSLVLNVSF